MTFPSDHADDTPDCCTPGELRAKRERGEEFIVLDVRTPEELEYAAIDGVRHIPLNELRDRLPELEAWRDKEIVTMCHHGMRSDMAREFLLDQGFTNVRNLQGGIDAYAAEVDPEVGRY